jgi:hypothetical protein
MICPARKSKILMIWTTLAPKLKPFGTSDCNANHINARLQLQALVETVEKPKIPKI